jgi:hypothetical protein
VTVVFSIAWLQGEVEPQPDGARDRLAAFHRELYRCFTARADALFEVADAVRLGPADDEAAVTAAQVRDVITRLIEAGHWRPGDPAILVIFDAGYDVPRLSFLLADLPVEVQGRLRSDRVMRLPAAPRRGPAPQARPRASPGRPGDLAGAAGGHQHGDLPLRAGGGRCLGPGAPRLTHRSAWLDHDGAPPVIEGTLVRLQVDHLPGDRDPKPVWLWSSATGATPDQVDQLWQAFLRRFDLEHTFRLFKQILGWTTPKIRDPAAADRWTWLIIAAHAQLRLARPLAADLRHPWEPPAPPGQLTRPGPAGGLETSARPSPAQPVCRNPASPAPGARQVRRTATPHPATTWGNHQKGTHAQGTPRTYRLKNKLSACF